MFWNWNISKNQVCIKQFEVAWAQVRMEIPKLICFFHNKDLYVAKNEELEKKSRIFFKSAPSRISLTNYFYQMVLIKFLYTPNYLYFP